MKYKYNPPSILKKIFNQFYWNTTNNKILLTFDDGPIPESTEIILSELSKHKIKALFFCVGDNIRKHPSLAKEILAEGHTIGNHTFNHKILKTLSYEDKIQQIQSFIHLMKEEFNYEVKYFRPPHGKFQLSTNNLLTQFNLQNVMWSLLTYDYKNNFELVKFAVTNFLNKNSIVVLHDSLKSKEIIRDSILFIADEAAKKNFSFGEPSECLK
ncbi:MAG: polysaccharide deacetylase family protein [Ignavibacterium album]|uniref:polysaccharide deacetylase family protein n=1 Tax=Ignavibacterium album TaxID=591197 RepID=UPI0026ECE874|nr:polysaccharide deacetylase family protein [Ignavibacterium album]MCX8106761.1 polysaccharide deacetylase family protein [Ignavibacterium album]